MIQKIISFFTALITSITALFQVSAPQTPPPQTETEIPGATSTATEIPKIEIQKPTSKNPKFTPPAPAPEPQKILQTLQPEETPKPAPPPKSVKPGPIDLRSVVGLLCEFENAAQKTQHRGSGVVIREGTYKEGTYILTNRHVVDLEYANKISGSDDIDPDLKLKECKVHILKTGNPILPEERYPYPYYDLKTISGLQYDFRARLAYLPETAGLSADEIYALDYAILEITEKNQSKYFAHENPRLPAAPALIPEPEEWFEIINEKRVVMPGYAFQQAGSGSFEEFRLLTKDGVVKDIYAGDKKMQNTPISLIIEIPPDAYGGRSGSPIFYQGYLIGLVATKALPAPNSGDFRSPQPAITGIMENIKSRADIRNIFQNITYFE